MTVERLFLDTEFIEDGRTIDLISISIAIVHENRRLKPFYRCNLDCNLGLAIPWVRENVMPHLPPFSDRDTWSTKKDIASGVNSVVREATTQGFEVEFWAYFADYKNRLDGIWSGLMGAAVLASVFSKPEPDGFIDAEFQPPDLSDVRIKLIRATKLVAQNTPDAPQSIPNRPASELAAQVYDFCLDHQALQDDRNACGDRMYQIMQLTRAKRFEQAVKTVQEWRRLARKVPR